MLCYLFAAAEWPTFPEGIYLDCAPNPGLVGQNETCKGGFSVNAYLQLDVTCCFRTIGAASGMSCSLSLISSLL
jgi:hypothetical protein